MTASNADPDSLRDAGVPDPGATGVDDSEAPTPAGSAAPSGDSELVQGAEVQDGTGDDGLETPVAPS